MIKKAFRSIISISRWSLIALSIFPISTAHADSNPIITEPTDFWFSYSEPTRFLAQTYQSVGYESDPQLWLYNSDTGEEIASNDDYIGLQSKIDLDIPAGNYRLRAATCCGNPNGWNSGWGWNIQYELSFNGNPVSTTTTTEVTTSLPPEVSTTTTQPELPTTTSSTTTETPTTTWVPTTTSTEPPTTTTTIAPTTSVPVTEVPPTEAPTTTEITSTTLADSVAPSTTPTTSQSVTTVEVPQTSLIPTTTLSPFFPTPLTTSSTSAPPTATSVPTTTPTITTEPTEPPTTNTSPPVETATEVIDNLDALPAEELVSAITELSDEELTNLVESIDVSSLTEESISAVFSEEVLNELSDDQVTELIDAIVPSDLSDDQALALSESLTNAPDNVKEEFEQQIDVFGGQFDTYVPTGSAVSVGARRVLVAAAAATFAMPSATPSSRKGK